MLKSSIITLFSSILILSSLSYADDKEKVKAEECRYPESVAELKNLVERVDSWRSRSMRLLYDKETITVLEKRNLSSREVKTIQNQINLYKDLREKIIPVYMKKFHYSKHTTSLNLTNKDSTATTKSGSAKITYKLNPNDHAGKNHIAHIKVGLIAALLLYDNYILAVSTLQESKKLRRLVNSDAVSDELTNTLEEISASFVNLDNYKHMRRVLNFILKTRKVEKKNNFERNCVQKYLDEALDSSYLFTNSDLLSYNKMLGLNLRQKATGTVDLLSSFGNDLFFALSKAFGNGAGGFQSRDEKLKTMPYSQRQALEKKLKPLDILFEKTPFRLTDKFIPGHWGHAAIWTGSEEQLKEMGIWNHPRIRKHQKAIRAGKRIIEALRPGVEINTLEHFLDIDDLAIIRQKNLDEHDADKFMIRAFDQVGKEYDFNFDVETDKKIVCSELIYVTYFKSEYNWPTDKSVGRYTITPDNVAEKVKSGQFETVVLYHDGREITSNLDGNFMQLVETSELQ